MTNLDTYIFKGYVFDCSKKTLELKYAYSDDLVFKETYFFDFDFVDYDQKQLDRAFQHLLYIAGVSYFKAYLPKNIQVESGTLTSYEASYYSKTYQKGLGEFFYVNKLDPRTEITFKSNTDHQQSISGGLHDGMLVGIGGGKDSLVVVEALKSQNIDFMTWSIGHLNQLKPLIEKLGTKHATVTRVIDPKIRQLNEEGVYNGHIPWSAVMAATGTVVAILTGRRDVVVGNEQSANEPTLNYQGTDINHQYSKTQEFEKDYQKLLKENFDDSIRYYSFLRPLSELFIGEIFAKIGFQKYKDVFVSCNLAYTLYPGHTTWCGECPKCAFIFMILTPFIDRQELESVWQGKNLLLDPELKETYRQLLGISGDKPMECVGEIKEARTAMQLCFKKYPELQQEYSFNIPEDYDYKYLFNSEMPDDIQKIFNNFIANFKDV
jgi:hypothetical protein